MSFHLITIDQLMQLDQLTLEYALRLFQKELDGTIAFLSQDEHARQDEPTLSDLNHLLTLRKVFKLRIAELQAEAKQQVSPTLATAA
jgi:hypothetical protein